MSLGFAREGQLEPVKAGAIRFEVAHDRWRFPPGRKTHWSHDLIEAVMALAEIPYFSCSVGSAPASRNASAGRSAGRRARRLREGGMREAGARRAGIANQLGSRQGRFAMPMRGHGPFPVGQSSCLVGRNTTSFTSTSSGWAIVNATIRAKDSAGSATSYSLRTFSAMSGSVRPVGNSL